MSDESKTNNAKSASEKVGAANLEQMNVSDLRKLITNAQELASKKVEEEKEKLFLNFQREAKKLGLSARVEWIPLATSEPKAKTRKKSTDKVAAKYRGPNGEEWAGRGRKPNWLAALEKEGRNREELLIARSETEAEHEPATG